MLSYTAEVFYAFLEEYNLAIWPAQIVALGLAFVGYFLCVMRSPFSGWTLTGILVLFWTWNAVIFFWFQFGEIDFSAPIYAGFFALQVVPPDLRRRPATRTGLHPSLAARGVQSVMP